ncbi:somatic embryoproteinsis receptor kinase 1-like [Hibiscus syriacus]|uniref:Somatic embryoproteinsis receptor kinase 1-like n=1 Tax=Hibiscus syriacus TaxID=106335 RepID=A0A6A2YCI6_HIBSY|nr:somatic embryoproteinsis receptor kinase 1-like [Hibiscus syriacus]
MKTSLRRLRGLAHHKHTGEAKERNDVLALPQLEELAQASQDMQDMRDCYDSLLSAAAATTNCAYEFSESLREMGTCLLEKTALNDDEESGRVLLMLGKRSHISKTITVPSESLLNELRIVEEMKRQCDEKRDVYEHMATGLKEKGRSKGRKGENFSMQQLQVARDEYDEEATLFVFRLKSLKQGQSRSLLTQAARHHAAQLNFFKKALKSLEEVEPHVQKITELQHIDYRFSGLEDDDGDNDDDTEFYEDDDDYNSDEDDGELSFDYVQNDQDQNMIPASRHSMESDEVGLTFPQVATVEAAKENPERTHRHSFSFGGAIRNSSQSAPLFAGNKPELSEKIHPLSTRKFSSYVLPTPVATKGSIGLGNPAPQSFKSSLNEHSNNLWHSSPLELKKYERILGDEKKSGSAIINAQVVLKESNNPASSTQLPPPLVDKVLFSQVRPTAASDSKKIKRQAFSGPLKSKPGPHKPVSVEHPQLFSGPILRTPMSQVHAVSPKASPNTSPKFVSTPKISELHELPRPPATSASKSSRPSGLVGYSGPLMPRGQVLPATNKSKVSKTAAPLPQPPDVVTRSFSIPSFGHRVMSLPVSKPLETANSSGMSQDLASPPLTPISLSQIHPSSTNLKTADRSDSLFMAIT